MSRAAAAVTHTRAALRPRNATRVSHQPTQETGRGSCAAGTGGANTHTMFDGLRDRAVSGGGAGTAGAGRDLTAARAAYDVGDIELSRVAHEAKIHGEEAHAG